MFHNIDLARKWLNHIFKQGITMCFISTLSRNSNHTRLYILSVFHSVEITRNIPVSTPYGFLVQVQPTGTHCDIRWTRNIQVYGIQNTTYASPYNQTKLKPKRVNIFVSIFAPQWHWPLDYQAHFYRHQIPRNMHTVRAGCVWWRYYFNHISKIVSLAAVVHASIKWF